MTLTVCIGCFYLGVSAMDALGQNSPEQKQTTRPGSRDDGHPATPSGGSASDNANSAILQELERMRSRIQQLEAELKQQSAGATAASADSGQQQSATVEHLVDPQTSKGQTATASQTESKPAKAEPFAFADFTWLNGNARTKELPLDTKFFTPEIRAEVDHIYDFRHPKDDTIGGSSEVFRANEVARRWR
jgi:hypothetical protein